nr:hypothetical protein [Fimbriiglobus sp.]
MSSASDSAASSATAEPPPERPRSVKVVSHSPIYYWWPVWFTGFILAGLTYFNGHVAAVVPDGSVAESQRDVEGYAEPRDVVVLPAGRTLPTDPETGNPATPHVRMSSSSALGMVWAFVLTLVLVVTHIRLRGLWSVLVIVVMIFTSILFAVLGWWEPIIHTVGLLDIRMNAFGYLSISLVLFVIWVLTYYVYDRYAYMIFTPGQLRVRDEIGAGETAYDVRGMIVEKHRDDLFRHWLLGFGTGDLTVRVGGAGGPKFEMHNVTRINHKLHLVQQMLQEQEVVAG